MLEITKDKLQPMLQAFNSDLGMYINEDQKHKLGRVLTVIDAAIADPEQRKAIKDLINNFWWSDNNRLNSNRMASPHTDLRAMCKVLGFELYEPSDEPPAPNSSDYREESATKHYAKLASNEQ